MPSFPMPGRTEFSADEEKAMRQSSAANPANPTSVRSVLQAAEAKGMGHAPSVGTTQIARVPPIDENDDFDTRMARKGGTQSDDATDAQ